MPCAGYVEINMSHHWALTVPSVCNLYASSDYGSVRNRVGWLTWEYIGAYPISFLLNFMVAVENWQLEVVPVHCAVPRPY